mmetsp:Transcript_18354/g.51150  ORF Transcript_18354/g.51150 Transcript_18354/m.51150 type:complete len:206 (+) Transcript_18354:276-893(+)
MQMQMQRIPIAADARPRCPVTFASCCRPRTSPFDTNNVSCRYRYRCHRPKTLRNKDILRDRNSARCPKSLPAPRRVAWWKRSGASEAMATATPTPTPTCREAFSFRGHPGWEKPLVFRGPPALFPTRWCAPCAARSCSSKREVQRHPGPRIRDLRPGHWNGNFSAWSGLYRRPMRIQERRGLRDISVLRMMLLMLMLLLPLLPPA